MEVTAEEMARYRATAERRWRQDGQRRLERHAHAWEVARQAARLLMDRFGAARVVVFGSLLRPDYFSETSDIDLAAWGLSPTQYFRAVAELQDLTAGFSIDLVAMERCPTNLQEVIEREGQAP